MTRRSCYQPVDRAAEAAALLARRREWLVGRTDDGVSFALIPSRSVPGKYHRVAVWNLACDCRDYQYRGRKNGGCAHARALELAIAAKSREQQQQA